MEPTPTTTPGPSLPTSQDTEGGFIQPGQNPTWERKPTAAQDYAQTATGGAPAPAGPALVRDGATIASAEMKEGEFKLSDGRTVRLLNLRGDAVPKARRLVEGLVDFQDALVSLAVLIDGRPITPEELHGLELRDSLALHSAFNEKNG